MLRPQTPNQIRTLSISVGTVIMKIAIMYDVHVCDHTLTSLTYKPTQPPPPVIMPYPMQCTPLTPKQAQPPPTPASNNI